jgi:hypothetical protein
LQRAQLTSRSPVLTDGAGCLSMTIEGWGKVLMAADKPDLQHRLFVARGSVR